MKRFGVGCYVIVAILAVPACSGYSRGDSTELQRPHPKSCRDVLIRESGVYSIQPEWPFYDPIVVYCDQDYEYGAWTIIQRRIDGTVNFDRDFRDYREGFGNIDGEFWLGLENIYRLVFSEPHELLIWLKDFSGNTSYARYAHVNMKRNNYYGENYYFHVCGSYSGSAGDVLCGTSGNKFYYIDAEGGFWNSNLSNLNGRYVPKIDPDNRHHNVKGLYWGNIKAGSIKETKMMLRPKARRD